MEHIEGLPLLDHVQHGGQNTSDALPAVNAAKSTVKSIR